MGMSVSFWRGYCFLKQPYPSYVHRYVWTAVEFWSCCVEGWTPRPWYKSLQILGYSGRMDQPQLVNLIPYPWHPWFQVLSILNFLKPSTLHPRPIQTPWHVKTSRFLHFLGDVFFVFAGVIFSLVFGIARLLILNHLVACAWHLVLKPICGIELKLLMDELMYKLIRTLYIVFFRDFFVVYKYPKRKKARPCKTQAWE